MLRRFQVHFFSHSVHAGEILFGLRRVGGRRAPAETQPPIPVCARPAFSADTPAPFAEDRFPCFRMGKNKVELTGISPFPVRNTGVLPRRAPGVQAQRQATRTSTVSYTHLRAHETRH